MNKTYLVFLTTGALLLSGIATSQESDAAKGVNGLSSGVDCTEVNIAYQNDPSLTQKEKLELMNQAFFASLNKFDLCQNLNTETESSGGGGESASSGGGGESAASAEMSGTEAAADQSGGGLLAPDQANEPAVNSNQTLPPAEVGSAAYARNGKLPEDIPSADNDSVLEAQIRYAAMNEPDPETREKLWDEYRKYKGISKK